MQGVTEVCVIGSTSGRGRTSDISLVLTLGEAGCWGHVALDTEILRVTDHRSQKLGFPSDLRTHLVQKFLSFSWSLHLHVIKLQFFSPKKKRHLVQPFPFTHGDIERKVEKKHTCPMETLMARLCVEGEEDRF